MAEAQRATRERRGMPLGMVAHELNQPLGALTMRLELLAEMIERGGGGDLQAQVNKARGLVSDISGIVGDVALYSEIERNTLRPMKAPLSLAEVVTAAADRVGATVTVHIAPDCEVAADRRLLGHVLANLLHNAAKYGGGVVDVYGVVCGDKVSFSVCDDGPGIPELFRASVMKPGFRLPRDKSKSGSGLGLYICRKLMDAMRGQIVISATQEGGCMMLLTLPRAERCD